MFGEIKSKLSFLTDWTSQFDPSRPDEGFSKTYCNLDQSELQTSAEMLFSPTQSQPKKQKYLKIKKLADDLNKTSSKATKTQTSKCHFQDTQKEYTSFDDSLNNEECNDSNIRH